jgi:hypothetical protein
MAQEQLGYALSEKTRIRNNGKNVEFLVLPVAEGSEGLPPTVITYSANTWKKLKYNINTIDQMVKKREEGSVPIIGQKYVYVKEGANVQNGDLQVNIITHKRGGGVFTPASIWLTEKEWETLVECEPLITKTLDGAPSLAKRKAQAHASRSALMCKWYWGDKSSDEYFFSPDHARHHFQMMHPDVAITQVDVRNEMIPPPYSVTQFMKHALSYCLFAMTTDHHGETPASELMMGLEVPDEWLKSAYTHYFLQMGLPCPHDSEPYVECVKAYVPKDVQRDTALKIIADMPYSPMTLLCNDIPLCD